MKKKTTKKATKFVPPQYQNAGQTVNGFDFGILGGPWGMATPDVTGKRETLAMAKNVPDPAEIDRYTKFLQDPNNADILERYKAQGYTASSANDGNAIQFSRGKGIYDVSPGFKMANKAIDFATAISNKVGDIRGYRDEHKKYLESIIPQIRENKDADGLNSNPIFYQAGGAPMKPIIAEAGEVYQSPQGGIAKIPDHMDTHDDASGGVQVNDAFRVLEDTGDKRSDVPSKLLLLSPDELMKITGAKSKKPVTHSKAFELGNKKADKDVKEAEKFLNLNVDDVKRSPNDPYAKNSLELNFKRLGAIKTKGELFDNLFDHQEQVKAQFNIDNAGQKAKNGKYNIAQNGAQGEIVSPRDKPTTVNISGGESGVQVYYDPATGRWKYLNHRKGDMNPNDPRFDEYVPEKFNQSFTNQYYNGKGVATATNPNSTLDFSGRGNDRNTGITDDPNFLGFKNYSPGGDFHGFKNYMDYLLNGDPTPEEIADMERVNAGAERIPADGSGSSTGNPNDAFSGVRGKSRTIGGKMVVTTTPGTLADGTPAQPGKPINTLPAPASKFDMPLNYWDTAVPTATFIDALRRKNVKENQIELTAPQVKYVNPLPALQAGQESYNAALKMMPDNGVGYANAANVFGKKYAIDNQVIGQYQSTNNGIWNAGETATVNTKNLQNQANQQSRELADNKQKAGLEAQRQQLLRSMDDIATVFKTHNKYINEGNLLMKLFPNYDQQGLFNGNQYNITPATPQRLIEIQAALDAQAKKKAKDAKKK